MKRSKYIYNYCNSGRKIESATVGVFTISNDYSDTLDNPAWDVHHQLPEDGVPAGDLIRSGCSNATIEFGHSLLPNSYALFACSTGRYTEQQRQVTHSSTLGLPLDAKNDSFFRHFAASKGKPMPEQISFDADYQRFNFLHCVLYLSYTSHPLFLSCAGVWAQLSVTQVGCCEAPHLLQRNRLAQVDRFNIGFFFETNTTTSPDCFLPA